MDMDVASRTQSQIEIRARIIVLHEAIHELAKGYGIEDHSILEFIKKGILIQQVLQTIHIYYLNSEGKAVGKATMVVDWKKHELLAKSESGREFRIDVSKGSILEQISNAYKDLVALTQDIRKYYNVQETKVMYNYRDEIYADETRLQEVRKSFGTSPGAFPAKIELSDDELAKAEDEPWIVTFGLTAGDLSELGTFIEFYLPKNQRMLFLHHHSRKF